MSITNAKKFIEKLVKDKQFNEAFLVEAKKGDKNAIIAFTKKAGLECTREELKEVYGGIKNKLTKEELNSLHGGGCGSYANDVTWMNL